MQIELELGAGIILLDLLRQGDVVRGGLDRPLGGAVAGIGIHEKPEAEKIVAVIVKNLIGRLGDAVVFERHPLLLHEGEERNIRSHEKGTGEGRGGRECRRRCNGRQTYLPDSSPAPLGGHICRSQPRRC
jgi:hypothetical protein